MEQHDNTPPPDSRQDSDPSRRRFLEWTGMAAVAALAGNSASSSAATPQAPEGWPTSQTWYPTRWGPADQAGASNMITPQKVLEAASLIRTGEIHSLGRVYEAGMPFFGTRGWNLKIPSAPFYGPAGRNKLIANEEYLCAEIGQVGSQFDGLSHIGVESKGTHDNSGKLYYNGFSASDVHGPFGMKKLGVEHVKPFFTRAVIFDVKGLKGRNLQRGEEILAQDLKDALTHQGMSEADFREGDVALIRTGWGDQWMVVDNKKFYDGEPGVGLDASQWLVSKGACMVGADNWGVEVIPNPDRELNFPCHHLLLMMNGVFMFENLTFESPAKRGLWVGAFVFSPVPVKGATGSPGNPLFIV